MISISVLAIVGNAKADFVFGEPASLGPTINGPEGAFMPSLSVDELELYFCAKRPGGYGDFDIWVTTRRSKDDVWGEPRNLGPLINTASWDGSPSLSGDGLSLYFVSFPRPRNIGLGDIWETRRATRNEDWGAPENLGAPVNTAGDEAFVSISSDELELYFSDWEPVQPGGYGGRDLWVTTRPTVSDPWAPPSRMDSPVNSPYHDEMFSISTDGSALLFSSWDRDGGYGRRDIWLARRTTTSDPWTGPVNLGPTINTPNFDQSGALSADGSTLYFNSQRPGGYSSFDLWQAPILPIVDFNGDGRVDSEDKSMLMDHWGQDASLCDIGPMPWGDGIVDIYDLMVLAEYVPEIRNPRANAVDVPRNVTLGWIGSPLADTYDVYFGRSLEDVTNADRANPLDVLVGEGQDTASYDPPGLLEFGQTYYWRVDEIGAPPESTIYKGFVWNFATELMAYPLDNVNATASTSEADVGPENTVNGSGLSADDTHSTAATDMWLAGGNGVDPIWIQYEFDKVYKLHEMAVWNYNVQFELVLGFGLKDVTVEYSENGTDWTVLGDVELAQATAAATYTANTTVDLGGVAAKYVRLTVNSGYGVMGKFGLSEVRFYHIPTRARKPEPADGESGVSPDTILSWHAGREAALHEVYLSTDRQAAVDGTALVDTVTEDSYQPGSLDPSQTYYWKVNEINEAETVALWEGDVWEFTTAD